jgi:GT2 family glycosyltransferase
MHSKKNPKVGIVVVNYNSSSDSLNLLGSLEQLRYDNFFLVIVDNNSTDNSRELLRESIESYREKERKKNIANAIGISEVVFIRNPENLGFAAGNNVGIYQAICRGAECVWLLNADTTVEEYSLSALVDFAMKDPESAEKIGALGSKILYGGVEKEPKSIWGAGGFINYRSQIIEMRGTGELDNGQYDSVLKCDYVPGCSLFFLSKVIFQVGYLPEEYFMYFEETDWCQKIKKVGLDLYYVPESVVFHHVNKNKMQTPFTVYYYNRNQRFFWAKYANKKQKIVLILKTLFISLPQAIKGFVGARESYVRQIFAAHIFSCFDFLLSRKFWRR